MPDVDVRNRHPAVFFFPNRCGGWRQFLVCRPVNRPCLSTSQATLVRLLSRCTNDSFMTPFLRVLLVAVLCCSASLLNAEDAPPTKLKYGAWGFDLAGMDTATKPGDDFFRYANGTWIDKTQIPPDKPAYSLRLAMTDLTEQRLHEMMESLGPKPNNNPSTLEEKVGAFYRSFMDETRVEQLGAKAIEPELNDLKNVKTRDDFAALMGRTTSDFEFSLFNAVIDADLKDPYRYAFYLTQAGIGLPDRDYYLKPDFAAQKTAYQNYVATVLKLLNWPDADKNAKSIVILKQKSRTPVGPKHNSATSTRFTIRCRFRI